MVDWGVALVVASSYCVASSDVGRRPVLDLGLPLLVDQQARDEARFRWREAAPEGTRGAYSSIALRIRESPDSVYLRCRCCQASKRTDKFIGYLPFGLKVGEAFSSLNREYLFSSS